MLRDDEGERRTGTLLALLLVLYIVARILQLYADRFPTLLIVVLHVLPPAVFALLHGKITYRWRGIVVFAGLSLGIATLLESVSLRTGLPFGHYYFTDVMGPKLIQLPVLLALAYVGMGYLSWVVGLLLVGHYDEPLNGRRMIFLPLVASFVMAAWDLSMDPVWSNLYRAWVWKDGGSFFGVPVSNFLGWYLTVYLFYQAFALYLRGRPVAPLPLKHWRLPVLFYGASAAGNVLLAIPSATPAVVTDASGRQWRSADILHSCVLVSIFVMGAFALTAWTRLSLSARDSV
ncbi:carotenoid biosynthesis protein [Tunturibacter empetritectus]|uniref:Membrane protein n=1 Tax=Tunturiibacter empetritectus TaxID=3069691 RepID=A0A7W8IJJ3_9BACT|nr:carotenoid biosynthesis protein [Edaphobacter lichenicola]MBB5318316.1 putative membrane protein [Edaphobacter lichenicola]